MLLPFLTFAGSCDGVRAGAAVGRVGKGEGDLPKNPRIRSRFLEGCMVKLISTLAWRGTYLRPAFAILSFRKRVIETGKDEAVMVAPITSCAAAA